MKSDLRCNVPNINLRKHFVIEVGEARTSAGIAWLIGEILFIVIPVSSIMRIIIVPLLLVRSTTRC